MIQWQANGRSREMYVFVYLLSVCLSLPFITHAFCWCPSVALYELAKLLHQLTSQHKETTEEPERSKLTGFTCILASGAAILVVALVS